MGYFTATGERVIYKDDDKGKRVKMGVAPSRVRFSGVRLADVTAFATRVYRREGIILDIHEVPYAPWDFTAGKQLGAPEPRRRGAA